MKKLSLFIPVAFALLLSGCTYRLTDFTIISTKNVDLSKASQFKRTAARIEGRDVAHIVLFFQAGRPNMKEAIDRAIESTKGAVALVDGVVYTKGWWALLYGQTIMVVEGTPLIDPSLTSSIASQPKDTYAFLELDKSGKLKRQKAISPEEYSRLKLKVVKDATQRKFKDAAEITAL